MNLKNKLKKKTLTNIFDVQYKRKLTCMKWLATCLWEASRRLG